MISSFTAYEFQMNILLIAENNIQADTIPLLAIRNLVCITYTMIDLVASILNLFHQRRNLPLRPKFAM